MKVKILVPVFLLFSSLLNAQESLSTQKKRDSLNAQFQADSIHIYRYKPIKPYANIEFTNSYVGNSFLSLVGLKGGVTLNNKHICGIGFYTLNKFPIFKSDRVKTYQFDKLRFMSLFYEYHLLDTKHFDILLPLDVGYGDYTAHLVSDTTENRTNSNMALAGLGIKLMLMPNRWIGLKLGGGYRYVWEKNAGIGIDGLYFTVGIRIDMDHAYRDVRYYQAKKKYRKSITKL